MDQASRHQTAPGRRVLRVVLPGLCAALAHVVGLLSVVNLEAKTTTVFLAGHVVGRLPGAITGILTTILHQFLNPYGPADPFFCAAQATAWALTGFVGASVALGSSGRTRLAAIGLGLTLVYHLLTDWAESVALQVPFLVFFANGFAPPFFTPLHLAWNALLFALATPRLESTLVQLKRELGAWDR